MSQPVAAPMSGLRRLSLVLAAGVALVPLALGKLFELALKAANPDDVDITQGLAYLRQLLIGGAVLFVVTAVLAVVVIRRLQRVEGREAAAPAWVVLATQVVLLVVLLAATGLLDAVEDAWVSANGG